MEEEFVGYEDLDPSAQKHAYWEWFKSEGFAAYDMTEEDMRAAEQMFKSIGFSDVCMDIGIDASDSSCSVLFDEGWVEHVIYHIAHDDEIDLPDAADVSLWSQQSIRDGWDQALPEIRAKLEKIREAAAEKRAEFMREEGVDVPFAVWDEVDEWITEEHKDEIQNMFQALGDELAKTSAEELGSNKEWYTSRERFEQDVKECEYVFDRDGNIIDRGY